MSMPGSIDKAVGYLERRLPSLRNPYAAAMVSYALANENKLDKDILKKFASPDSDHWPVTTGYLFTLEATAYALLALVKAKLSNGVDRTISKYEMNYLLSDKGSLILYLDSVSHTQRQEVAFRIRRTMRVGVLQPAAVSVYEYYNLYKVYIESIDDHVSTDIYQMRIMKVIKQGSFDTTPLDNLRTFIGYNHCRQSLNLATGRSYLIMGTYDNTEKISENEYQYVLGEKTWIEYWPTDEECQNPDYESACGGMNALEWLFLWTPCKQ
ncbi:hypothetical protein CRUP_019421 [Coryphaenoides rupestris]|nr:hypothetical protein CRUP_019421 [Coryphaenoides rupestris]